MVHMVQKMALDTSFCFWVSFFVFCIFLLFSIATAIHRLDIVKPLRVFGIGLAVCDFIILIPILHAIGECGDGGVASVSSAIMNMAQLVTLNVGYDALIKAADEAHVLVFFTILCVLTPAVWGGVVLTLFENLSSYLAYQIFSPFIPVYFFSELNENALMLAQSIKNQKGRKTLCIFCGISENTSPELKEEVKNNSFLLLKQSEASCIKNPKNQQTYFEISENQNENLTHTCTLIHACTKAYGDCDYSNMRIYLFSEQEEAPLLLNSIDKKGIPVILVDRDRFVAHDLLFTHPLYEVLRDGSKTISVLIVGDGRLANEILKTSVWCGQLGKNYHLKINAITKNASHSEKVMRLEYPEFFNGEYDISFFEADITTCDFEACLDEHCADVNYICVCSESDETNSHVALYLRAYYFRKNTDSFKKPFIAVCVRDSSKNAIIPEFTAVPHEKLLSKKIQSDSDSALNYNLFAFDSDRLFYSSYLIDSPLERIALNVHFGYELSFSEGTASSSLARKTYYANETGIRSNRANALHIRYKLFLLGYDLKALSFVKGAQESERDELAQKLQADIETNVLMLSLIEHDRWNAFMRSEGWRSASLEQAKKAGTHKITRAKMHACLCTWDELDPFAEFDPKFKEYDEIMIKNIPYLLGLIPHKLNISGVNAVLEKRSNYGN